MSALPYGSWPSPITATDLAGATIGLDYGVADGDRIYWTEGYAQQGGRVALWCRQPDRSRAELVPEHSVRSGINEYGGGAWTAAAGIVVFSSHASGELWMIEDDVARAIAPGGAFRYGCVAVDPARRLALAVREDHSAEDTSCVQSLVAVDLDASVVRVLAEGADFYATPVVRPDGHVAWVQWNLPDMPWDASELWVAPLDHPEDARLVAGGDGVSVAYPQWADDGSLTYLADQSGYWNFQRWDGADSRALHADPFDFCYPPWTPGPAPYSLLSDGRIACSWYEDGYSRPGVLDPSAPRESHLTVLDADPVSCTLTGRGDRVVALLGYADRPTELRVLDLATGADELLQRTTGTTLPEGLVSAAHPITWESPDGPVHAWFYPPRHPDHTAREGELPPVQVWSHGGPTGFSGPAFRLDTQYWTSRGIGILDVNYSGSAGYGRAYRQRLDGRWGISDVRDCVGCVRALVDAGLADPRRLSIRGGSAGGFTTLAALTSTDVFSAGVSLCGIADLEAMTGDTHKFESRYLDRLVAPYPDDRATYVERSPIHHLDRLSCPMLIVQGRRDVVVPPEQAESMAAAVRAKGLPVELIMFAEEGHMFRRSESIVTIAEAVLAFLGRVHGFRPA